MLSLFFDYFKWHYTHAIVTILKLGKEFVRFFLNLFSVSLFLRTLFLPLFSIPVDDVDSSFLSDLVAVYVGGLLIRIMGAIFRSLFIIAGLFFSLLTVLFFSTVFLLWLVMPLCTVGLFVYISMLIFRIV